MQVTIVGSGYVGLVTGGCLADFGHRVTCVDRDEALVARLREGKIHIFEPGLGEIVARTAADGRLRFETDLASAAEAEVVLIAVGTPETPDGKADLSAIFAVADALGPALGRAAVVATKSTVPVGTGDELERRLRVRATVPVHVVSNPEFLKEGDAVRDFLRPARIVLGGADEGAIETMKRLYAPIMRTSERFHVMDRKSAELCKYVSNAYLATRISFINEIANLCDAVGADVEAVRKAAGADPRIGLQYFFPGAGWGGSCLVGRETVSVRSGGLTRLVRLDALFREQGEEGDVRRPSGLEVLAWNPRTMVTEFAPVVALTRRRYEGELVGVRTKMGRRLRCTPDHPFVAADAEGRSMRTVLASDLREDDWLPVALGAPRQEPVESLDVLACLAGIGIRDEQVIVRPREGVLNAFSSRDLHRALEPLGHPRGTARAMDILRAGALRLHEARHLAISLEGASLATTTNGTYVPTRIPVDEAFWRVVGLYLAEGHCTADGRRRRISWSFHPEREEWLVEEVAGFWRSLGVKVDVRRGTTSRLVTISSRILAGAWVERLGLGGDCYSHRIPDEAWSAPEAHRRRLLSGLWHGDGSCSLVSGGPSVVLEYGTVSRELADGMLRLLAGVGIVARQKIGRVAKSTVDTYWFVVSGAEQVEAALEFVAPHRRKAVQESIARQARRIAPTGYRRREGAAWVRVTSTKRRRFRGFVYSLEAPPSHTFVTTGGLVTHNCFPKDLVALVATAQAAGTPLHVVEAADRANRAQWRLLERRVREMLGELSGRSVAVWGLSFKPNTDDIRHAPALVLIDALLDAGAVVSAHDPVAIPKVRPRYEGRVRFDADPYVVAQGAEALVVATEWPEYRGLDPARLHAAMKEPRAVVDGRNVWAGQGMAAKGFAYAGVGVRR